MDVSELRKQILRALDDARKDAASRREHADQAASDYERFLSQIAAPLFKQAANVLRAEGHPFTADTPGGSVRLSSDHVPDDFLELELATGASGPQVIGRTSLKRARQGMTIEERPIAVGKSVAALTEEDVSSFLMAEIRRLVAR